jgi:hypothetical protein
MALNFVTTDFCRMLNNERQPREIYRSACRLTAATNELFELGTLCDSLFEYALQT